jgi:hypothetical protein
MKTKLELTHVSGPIAAVAAYWFANFAYFVPDGCTPFVVVLQTESGKLLPCRVVSTSPDPRGAMAYAAKVAARDGYSDRDGIYCVFTLCDISGCACGEPICKMIVHT